MRKFLGFAFICVVIMMVGPYAKVAFWSLMTICIALMEVVTSMALLAVACGVVWLALKAKGVTDRVRGRGSRA